MARFLLRPKAEQDLESIWHYSVETWGEEQADIYIRQLNDGFQRLANAPNSGLDCNLIREGYLKYSANKHVIFYRVMTEEIIEVVRVLHQRMDLEGHLLDE